MIGLTADFHSKLSKGREAETKRLDVSNFFLRHHEKGKPVSQVSEHTFKVLCRSENNSYKAWISFKTLVVVVGA